MLGSLSNLSAYLILISKEFCCSLLIFYDMIIHLSIIFVNTKIDESRSPLSKNPLQNFKSVGKKFILIKP